MRNIKNPMTLLMVLTALVYLPPIAVAADSTSYAATNVNYDIVPEVPVGGIMYGDRSAIPEKWLEANGSYVSRTTYPDLYAVMGCRHGCSGNNFRLPDLRGEFLRGLDHGRGLDSGRSLGSVQADGIKDHYHYMPLDTEISPNTSGSWRRQYKNIPGYSNNPRTISQGWAGVNSDNMRAFYNTEPGFPDWNGDAWVSLTGHPVHTNNRATSVSDGQAENRPRNVALTVLIKVLP